MKKIISVILMLCLLTSGLSCTTFSQDEYGKSTELLYANYALAREAAGEGVVLLENNGALPLVSSDSVSLFGIGSVRFIKGGTGSGLIYTDYSVNLLDGMRSSAAEGRFTVNESLATVYEEYYNEWDAALDAAGKTFIQKAGTEIDEIELTDEQVSAAKSVSDTAIYTISRIQGEGSDRSAVKGDYYISDVEAANLAKLNAAGFDKLVVVLNVGTAVDTSFITSYPNIDALVLAWLPGVEGGYAVADVLSGKVNPSGKLTDTFVSAYDDYPSANSFSESTSFVNYSEDIYNGYRYFETFDPEYTKVNYEFGYGMSYTSFSFTEDSVTNDGESINVSVKVTNTGDVAGKEVVQVYFSAPQGLLGKAAKELCAYEKTKLLAPGESQTISTSFAISDMASFDDLGKTGHKSAYVLEAGDYSIYIGNSIKNAGQRGAKGTYNVMTTTVTDQLTSLLTPQQLSRRLTSDGSYESLSVSISDDGSYKLDPTRNTTIIEAENYHAASDGITCPVLPDQENLKYVTGLSTGKYVSYNFTVEEDTEFCLSLAVSNSGETIDTPFKIYLGDTELENSVSVLNSGTSGGVYTFKEVMYGTVLFVAGKSTLKIVSQTDSAVDLDSFTLSSGLSRPKISANAPTVIQAESADVRFNNNDTTLPISNESAFGEVLVAKLSGVGKYLEYNLYSEAAGTYELLFNYAATGSYTTPFDIYVNGINQNAVYTLDKTSPAGVTASSDPMAYYNTSADADSPVEITLPKGFVTLRLMTRTSGAPNLNKVTLTKVLNVPEGCTVISATGSSVLEAEDYEVANSDAAGINTVARVTKLGETVLDYLSSTNGGRYLEYLMYVEEAGEYNVTVNCAAASSKDNPYSFYADGVLLPCADYTVAATGTGTGDSRYYTCADTNTLTLDLPDGEFTLKVLCGAGSIPNLNRLTFVKKGSVPEPEQTAPAGYVTVLPTEATTVEAETYSRNSNNMNFVTLTEGASKGEVIIENIHVGEWLEYKLWFKEGGTYSFNFNYAASGALTNPYDFYINETLATHEDYPIPKTSTGTSTYDKYFVFVDMADGIKLTVPQGSVTFKILGAVGYNSSNGEPNLNKFTVEKAFDVPEGETLISPIKVTTVEAENYTGVNNEPYSAQGNIVTRTHSTGMKFLEYLTSTTGGRYLTYDLYVPVAGKYDMTINYATNVTKENPFSFYADETFLPVNTYTLGKTSIDGGTTANEIYFNFVESEPIEINLPDGSYAFKLLCDVGQMPNLNSMTFTLKEAATEPEDPPTPEDPEIDEEKALDYSESVGNLITYSEVYNCTATLDDFVAQMTNLELIQLAGGHPPIDSNGSSTMGRIRKYGIPAVETADGGAGLRMNAGLGATCLPCSTMLACTWNRELIRRIGEAVGKEAQLVRVDAWLAPGLNIHRNPLCGRNFEYYSEDPLISGMCAAMITLGTREYGLHTVPKHFAVNNKETGRNISDSRISERALREIYLEGFRILVKEAAPRYIMTSYNYINGTEAAESHELIEGILRGEWGFNGIVMTDWANDSNHAKELLAGNNIKKQTGDLNGLADALASGVITRDDLKRNAKTILATLSDSKSMQTSLSYSDVDRSGTTYINGKDFNFVNDDALGTVTTAFTKGQYSYVAGDLYESGSWSPSHGFFMKGSSVLSFPNKTTNSNVTFAEPDFHADYFIDVAESGNYKLEIFSSSANTSVKANILVDGASAGTLSCKAAARDEKLIRTTPVYASLSKGKHEIRIKSATSQSFSIGKIAISPYYGEIDTPVDCKIFTVCNSEWGLSLETQTGEYGSYTHIVPNLTESVYDRRTDHWGLNADESVYGYMAFCYRTNYTGTVNVKALGGGTDPAYDTTVYTFTPNKSGEWTTSIIPLNGTTIFKQLHFSVFGGDSMNVSEDKYFDLLHYGFFKSEEDVRRYCSVHTKKPVTGKTILTRQYGESYYDDVLKGYISTAEITLLQNDNVVASLKENECGMINNNENACLTFGFEVPDGEYILSVKKPGYVPYSTEVTVTDGEAVVPDIALMGGDIASSYDERYGDGRVDIDDLIRLLRSFAANANELLRYYTDINEDGINTIEDIAILKSTLIAEFVPTEG